MRLSKLFKRIEAKEKAQQIFQSYGTSDFIESLGDENRPMRYESCGRYNPFKREQITDNNRPLKKFVEACEVINQLRDENRLIELINDETRYFQNPETERRPQSEIIKELKSYIWEANGSLRHIAALIDDPIYNPPNRAESLYTAIRRTWV